MILATGPAGAVGHHGESSRMGLEPRPLSVCLYTDVAPPGIGGAQTVLDCLARRLVAVGHRPIVLAPPARAAGDDSALGYPIHRHRRQVSKRLGTRLVLPRLLLLHLRHRFDIVHCHAAYPQAHVAATFRRLCGVPFVVRPHGSDILPDDVIRGVPRLERRLRRAITAASAVIAQGDYLRDVVAGVGVDPARIRVINNGVEVGMFARAEAHPHPRPYILGLGSLVQHKGFDTLVRGYARLPPDRPDLLIAGAGPEQASLRRLADGLGVGPQVALLGPVTGEPKVSLYRSAEFFVCPSRREPFANVILEAMASGRPVVATDVGGNRELVRHGRTGLLCPPESPQALAEAMRRLVENPALRSSLAEAAARLVVGYDWSAVADRYIDLYREVIAGGLAASPVRGGMAA